MEEAKIMKTPMSSSIKHDKDEKGKSIDSTMYRGMIEKIVASKAWTSTQLSYLNLLRRRLAKRLGLTWSFSSHRGGLSKSDGLDASRDDFGADFLTLVLAFYRGLHMDLVAPILSTVTGVEIQLDPESIFCILDIALVGLKVYESKVWPIMPGFKPKEVIQRMCGLADAQRMGKPLSHNLTVSSKVLHHMICSILLPRGEHLDEVSYLEAFLVNSILTGKWIHVDI
ncbi:hypothetical protein CK203_113182 [Vitis vinifera]|uniref:Uncharacterized protein n=1 Tax=Vitis vinifera TaxID=29760 RepID=A0A438FFE5_VITVI|nr:hypothetical protein CK203_113182 [Vitis vinifera]